jgi:phosphoribosylglycinamide formyltransferase-1
VTDAPLPVAVFASGGGTNFQALLDHRPDPATWRIALLVSNREAGAVERARVAGVPAVVIPTKDRAQDEVARDTLDALARHGISVILLAGYLRLLPPDVVRRYSGRILNIHPALLPDFGGKGMFGMHVHRAVVESGVPVTGASVHFVDEEYDRGAVFAQASVPVHAGDTPEDVAARVLGVEHELYPRAVDHFCAAVRDGRAAEPLGLIQIEGPHATSEEKR